MRAALLAFALAGATALAQTVTLDQGGQESATFNASQCDTTIVVTWRAQMPVSSIKCTDLDIWTSDSNCTDGFVASAGVREYGPIDSRLIQPGPGTGTVSIAVKDLPGFSASTDGGTTCGQVSAPKTFKVCAMYSLGTVSVTGGSSCSAPNWVRAQTPFTITYDSQPPNPPVINEVASQDQGLVISMSVDSDTAVLHLEVKGPNDAAFSEKAQVTTGLSTATITGLTNGDLYQVQAIAEDAAGNKSAPSNVATGTPVHTDGFWAVYRRNGGSDQGGCGADAGALIAWAGGLIARRVIRKRPS